MLRSAWMQQELLTTFNGTLAEVGLVPNHAGSGTFQVTLITAEGEQLVEQTLWDRSAENAFPESKELKQLVRDAIEPGRDLGHSDTDEESSKPLPGDTGRTAFQRILSVITGDRRRRRDPRAKR